MSVKGFELEIMIDFTSFFFVYLTFDKKEKKYNKSCQICGLRIGQNTKYTVFEYLCYQFL